MKDNRLITEIYNFTEELLDSDQEVIVTVGGYSMYPCLKPGDKIYIKRVSFCNLRPGNIVVFKADNKWVAHRVLKIVNQKGKNFCITKGDSCIRHDAPSPEENIVGKVLSYSRNDRRKKIEDMGFSSRILLWMANASLMTWFIRLWLWVLLFNKKGIKHVSAIYMNLNFITRTSKKTLRLSFVISFFLGGIPLLIIYLMKWLIDEISSFKVQISTPQNYYHLFVIIGFIAASLLFQTILSLLNNIFREKLTQSVLSHVIGLLHQKHSSLDLEYLEDADQQDKIHRAIQEAGIRPNKMISQILALWQSLISLLIITVLLFTIHWSVFFLIMLAIIPGFWIRFKFSKEMYKFIKTNSRKERECYYYDRILTNLAFAKELKLFGISNFFISRFKSLQDELHEKKNKLLKKRIFPDIFSQIFAVLLMFFSFAFVTSLAIKGLLTLGSVFLFFLVFQRGYAVIRDFFQSMSSLIEDSMFFSDFVYFMNLPCLRKETKHFLEEIVLHNSIKLVNVSFKYPSSKRDALHSVSIEIPKGKTVALVGHNGSGKTTLIKLLCGFYIPQKGEIRFDDIDISKINPDVYSKQITAVFQDFALYNLTAMDNIHLGDVARHIFPKEIEAAANRAGIGDVLDSLPLSYNTMLGNLFEKGEDLSMGQWQKIAIAKAFYRNSPILFMDEPASAMDAETECVLLQNLKSLAKNKTVVIVSHRFSTIKWADIIYVMDKGEVVEVGNHDDLLTRQGKYYNMYNAISH